MKNKWMRVRLVSDAEDYRPVYKPPFMPGPWWCSGYSASGGATIVAFVRSVKEARKQWPEADEVDIMEGDLKEPYFTDRFPKPSWWKPRPSDKAGKEDR